MRRVTSLVLGALAFVALASSGAALAQTESTTTTAPTTTTTTAPVATTTTLAPVIPPKTTTTTTRPGSSPTTTTTAKAGTGKPIPPPASGVSQPLDPSILGGTPLLDTSTTLFGVETVTVPQTAQVSDDPEVVAVVNKSNAPSGTTLVLAAVAWLASLGGLLVYAEDQRGARWRHLAR